MVGFGPDCNVADVNTVGIKGQGAGSGGGDPTEGPGARDFYNCLREEELRCAQWLHGCIADEMLNYADAMSLTTSRGHEAEANWTDQAHNIGFYNWFDQAKTRYISRVNARASFYGVVGAPEYNHPNTAFIYHAAAKASCMSRLKCNFARCYCPRKGCARCEEDGSFVTPNPNDTGNPGDTDPGKTARTDTITTDALQATTSECGIVIPRVFGAGRVKGNIIWAGNVTARSTTFTSETETEVVTENVDYTTVDLAVSVCAGEIGAIGRIWYGDRVIYNGVFETGGASRNARIDYDPKEIGLTSPDAELSSPFRVTVYRGTPDQRPHPLRLAAGQLPIAYRDQAYVVFENLALVGSGSIPDFVFEVIQTVDTSLAPTDVGSLATVPFNGAESDVLIADPTNNEFLVIGRQKAPLSRQSIVKLSATDLLPTNALLPDTDAFGVETLYAVDRNAVHMTPEGIAFFNVTGSATTYKKTYVFDSGPDRSRRVFGANSMVAPTGDYLRALEDGSHAAAFQTVVDANGFATRVGFFVHTDTLQIGRFDVEAYDIEILRRVTYPGPIAAVFTTSATLEDELRKYLYVFYWTGSGTARQLTARVYLLQAMTDVQVSGFDSTNLRFTEYSVNKAMWAGDDSAQIVSIMHDKRDGFLVINMRGTSGYVFKWLDGRAPWHTTDVTLPTLTAKQAPAHPSLSGAYRWIDTEKIYSLDLDTGAIRSEPLTAPFTAVGAQFYDQTTDSVVFIDDKTPTRYYANRVRRAVTTLGEVLEEVLRVGNVYTPIGFYADITTPVLGYVVTQQTSVRAVLEQLAMLYGLTVSGTAGIVITNNRDGQVAHPLVVEDLAMTNTGVVPLRIVEDAQFYTRVSLTYYDVDQLYATRTVAFDRSVIEETSQPGTIAAFDMPAVIDEVTALQFCERMMFRLTALQRRVNVVAPPASLLDAGDGVELEGETYRVRTATYQTGLGTVLELVSDPLTADRNAPEFVRLTDPVTDDDVVATGGGTEVQLINVPSAFPAGAVGAPILSASFMLTLSRTPSAPVTVTYEDVYASSGETSVTLSKAAVRGRLATAIGSSGRSGGIDHTTSLVVNFDTAPDQSLFNGDAFLGFGDRLLIVGTELIKFNGVAWSVDGKTATFTNLLRGRRNTDIYSHSHTAGEAVYLYEPGAFADAFVPTGISNTGAARMISLRIGNSLSRNWLGRLRSDVIIPPVVWRDDGFASLSVTKVANFVSQQRYWNDNVFETSRGAIIPIATNEANTLTPRPNPGALLFYILRAPYNDADFRANFVTSALPYEEFPTNPYIAATFIMGAQPGVDELNALPPYFCYMAVIGPYTLSATGEPQGMVAYGAFGPSSLYDLAATENLETRFPMTGAVLLTVDGYSRPF